MTLKAMVVTTIGPGTIFITYHWAGKKSANPLTVAAQVCLARARQEFDPLAPVGLVFGAENLLRAACKQHLLQLQGHIHASLDPTLEVLRKENDGIHVVRIGLGRDEAAVD